MPQRSTEFQKLVYLVKKHSADGSTVTESKFLVDSRGKEREVDICIERIVSGYPVTISIECVECKDPATVEWVEQMMGKHDDLPTNVLVLFSRFGFTKGAKEKAETYKKTIVALESLDETSAERLFGGASSLFFKSTSQTPTEVIIDLTTPALLPQQITLPIEVFDRVAIFNQSGQELANGGTFVNHLLRSPKAQTEFLRISEDHHRNFNFHTTSVTEGPGNPVYLQLSAQGLPILWQIKAMTIKGNTKVQTAPLALKHNKLEDTIVAWGTVPYEGKQAQFVASQDKTGETKASFAFGARSVQLQKPPE
jgi:hypothetical protein